jgi:hypothetical protein
MTIVAAFSTIVNRTLTQSMVPSFFVDSLAPCSGRLALIRRAIFCEKGALQKRRTSTSWNYTRAGWFSWWGVGKSQACGLICQYFSASAGILQGEF